MDYRDNGTASSNDLSLEDTSDRNSPTESFRAVVPLRVLFKLQGGICAYCGCEMIQPPVTQPKTRRDRTRIRNQYSLDLRACTRDHVFARSGGGSDKLDNIVGACSGCNNLKGPMDPHDFFRWLVENKERFPNAQWRPHRFYLGPDLSPTRS